MSKTYKVMINCVIDHQFVIDAESKEQAEYAGYEFMSHLPYHTINEDVNIEDITPNEKQP